MTRRGVVRWLAGLALVPIAAPAAAQEASPALRAAAEQVVAFLKGERQPADIFAPSFLAAVPAPQLAAVTGQLRAQYGAAQRVAGIEPHSATAGTIDIATERAVIHMNMVIDPQAPHLITGLLVTGADMSGDSAAAVADALAALPGRTSFAIARLGDGAPQLIGSREPDRALAVGSTFKLFILAELSRQIRVGRHRWNEVASLDRRSLPSGMLQNWPAGSPLTVHSLASLMISISDNTATDRLLALVGRNNVERMMATIGVQAAARNRPLLGTLEMFALKTAPETDQRAWFAADEAGRRRLLASRYALVEPQAIDPALFAGGPRRIVELEWFASASDLVRTMDWLRRHADATSLAVLAINPGGAPSLRQEFAYVGYKGGSEPGVLNLTWLVHNRAGVWHVVTGSWNNSEAAVDEARFLGIMQRALQLVR
jgi:beta-lactamase class A